MSLAFQFLRFGVLAVVTIVLLLIAGVFAFIPGERRAAATPTVISTDEAAKTLAALRPPKRARPVIAVIGANDGTETTDYLVPYGVLKRSGVADVFALGTTSGPMVLMPALTVVPDMTTAAFVRRYPDGADYVIVPALHDSADVAVRDFIKSQVASRKRSDDREHLRRNAGVGECRPARRASRDRSLVLDRQCCEGASHDASRA